MWLGTFIRIVSLSKCVLTWATGRHTPLIRCYEPIFCAHTHTHAHSEGCLGDQTCPLLTILFYLPLSTHPSLSIAAVSASLLPCPHRPPNTPSLLFIYPPLALSIDPPFPWLSSYTCPSSLPLPDSPLSLFFFLSVTTFPGLIAILSAGKCFVTSRWQSRQPAPRLPLTVIVGQTGQAGQPRQRWQSVSRQCIWMWPLSWIVRLRLSASVWHSHYPATEKGRQPQNSWIMHCLTDDTLYLSHTLLLTSSPGLWQRHLDTVRLGASRCDMSALTQLTPDVQY